MKEEQKTLKKDQELEDQDNEKEKMAYKVVKIWVPAYYRRVGRRRIRIRGYYKRVKIWVPSRW